MKSFMKPIRTGIDMDGMVLREGVKIFYLVKECNDGDIEISVVLRDDAGAAKMSFESQHVSSDGVNALDIINLLNEEDSVLEYEGGDMDGGRFYLEFHYFQKVSDSDNHRVKFHADALLDKDMEERFFKPKWL